MGVIIAFPDGSDWYINNFAFRRLLQRYAIFFPEDPEGLQQLHMVMAVGGIFLKEGEPRNASVLRLLQNVAERTIAELQAGKTLAPPDPEAHQDSLRVYGELLELVKRAQTGQT